MAKKDDLVSFQMEGGKEIDDILKGLPLAMQTKILRAVHREALKPVQQELVRAAPPGGDLPEAIKIVTDKDEPSAMQVGVVSSKKVRAYHARFLEYGTEKRQTKDGANRGEMTPKPFIVKIIEGKIDGVVDFVLENYAELVDKYLTRENKRKARKKSK